MDVRIAAQRSMTQGLAAPAPAKSPQSAAGSFFEALANLSGSSASLSKYAVIADTDNAPQISSGAEQLAKPESNRTVDGKIPGHDTDPQIDAISARQMFSPVFVPQALVVPADAKSSVKPATPSPSQPKPSSSTPGAAPGITNEDQGPHLSSTVLAAKIAAVVVLPPLPPIVPIPLPVAASSPAFQSIVDLSSSRKNVESKIGASEISATPRPAAVAASAVQSVVDVNGSDKNVDSKIGASEISATPLPAAVAAPAVQSIVDVNGSGKNVESKIGASEISATPRPAAVAAPAVQSIADVNGSGKNVESGIGASGISATTGPVAVTAPAVQSVVDLNSFEKNRESNAGSSAAPMTPADEGNQNPAHSEAVVGQKTPSIAPPNPADAKTRNNLDAGAAPQNPSASKPADSSSEGEVTQSPSVAMLPLVNLALPQFSIFPGVEGNEETANNNAPTIKAPDLSGTKASDPAGIDDAAKTDGTAKTPASASQAASAGSSVAAAGNTNPASQHAQAAVSQPAPAKSADAPATPIQAIAVQGAPRESTAHAQADAPADASRPSGQTLPPQTGDATATAAVNSARLIQSMSQTEMRVGMHSPEFGEISIRTMVSQQQMTAQISVDHGDLARAISTHIPAMQEKLGGETGLKALVEVSQGNMSFSGERGGSSPRQQPSQPAQARIESTNTSPEADHSVSHATTWAVSNGYRLDIRA
jgi:hypothetical protein